jgi:site-specific DNA recombinase
MTLQFDRCAIYTRQSRNSDSVLSSCEAQQQICRDMADVFKWNIVDVFADRGQSSETLMRPEMQRMLAAIELGELDRVIVYSVDRLTRRLVDFAKLLELFDRGSVGLSVATNPNFGDSASSRLATNIAAAAAQFEQELTKERMEEAREALKSQGRRVAGRPPFGYKGDPITKQLHVVPKEAELVRDFFRLAASGTTPAEIACLATASGLGEGQTWNPRRLLQILSNPVYAGFLPGETKRKGIHEALVTKDEFRQVRNHLDSRRKGSPKERNRDPHLFPLRGLLYCAKCSRAMSTNTSSRGNIRYRHYQCRSAAGGRPPCPSVWLNAWDMEEFVAAQIGSWEASPELAKIFRDEWPSMISEKKYQLLHEYVVKVTYNADNSDVDIELNDESAARFEKEKARKSSNVQEE